MAIGAALIGWTAFRLADQGLANALGLETLRHGTNLINYISIKIFGGLPSHGGKSSGAAKEWHEDHVKGNTIGYFFVLKDMENDASDDRGFFYHPVMQRTYAILFKFASGSNAVRIVEAKNTMSKVALEIFYSLPGLITAIIVPSLKFRVTKEEIKDKFQDDPSFAEAYRTPHDVPMWKIGVLGSITQGLNKGVFSRIANNPSKAIIGVLQLAVAAKLAAVALATFPPAAPFVVPIAIGMAVIG